MRLFTATLLKTAMIVCGSLISREAFSQEPAIEENSRALQVKYLDGDNDALRFNLKYDNNSGDNFKLMVVNENGDVLYQNNFSGRNFKKHVKLPRLTETDDVTFLIRPVKSNIQLRYKVRVTTKVTDTPAEEDN
jgi:hypothetical protein